MKSRILVKTAFGDFASDWEERNDVEMQELHAAVQLLLQGEMAYLSLISKKSTIYLSEMMTRNAVVLIQSE